MTTNPDLEDRLRTYMHGRADELRLVPLDFDELLEQGMRRAPVSAPRTSGRRPTWVVAASLVAGATLGAGAILLTRDDPPPAAAPTVVPQQVAMPEGNPSASPGAPFESCSSGEIPSDVANMGLPNDIRINGILLPTRTPDGYCVGDHFVDPGSVTTEYTVWSSCDDCERPSASVALVRADPNLDYESEAEDHTELTVGGRAARYYPPDDAFPVARLFVDQPADFQFILTGWGLDESAMASVATAVLADGDDASAEGLQMVFHGWLGYYAPGLIPTPTSLLIQYGTDGGGGSLLVYRASEYSNQPPLEAYAWVRPKPVFTTTDAERSVMFPASASFAGTEQTTIIRRIDDNTTVSWSSNGSPPVSIEDLAAIEVTPAGPDDPRWDEIAYESGQYDEQG